MKQPDFKIKLKEHIQKYSHSRRDGDYEVLFHNRWYRASTKRQLLHELIETHGQMVKCPIFDACGKIFEGVSSYHEHCHDDFFAKHECDLRRRS